MKKLSAFFLVLTIFFSSAAIVLAENQFSDVSKDHWAYDEIQYLSNKGIINGYGNGKFGDEDPVTREQAATMLVRALNHDINNREHIVFQDVSQNDSSYWYIVTAIQEGIFTNSKIFNPKENLTRAQMAAILTRAFQLESETEIGFSDVRRDHWAYQDVSAFASNRLTAGVDELHFVPEENVTRAQFSVFLTRALEESYRPSFVILPQVLAEEVYSPIVIGSGNIVESINKQLYEIALDLKADFDEVIAYQKEMEGTDPNIHHYYFSSIYEIKRNDHYLSILFSESSYTGGAHGMTWQKSVTFDMTTGESVLLKDLLANEEKISAINEEIARQVKEIHKELGSDIFWETPTVSNDHDRYYLTNEGIMIYYDLYEYTPYVYGIPEFTIPYSMVQSY